MPQTAVGGEGDGAVKDALCFWLEVTTDACYASEVGEGEGGVEDLCPYFYGEEDVSEQRQEVSGSNERNEERGRRRVRASEASHAGCRCHASVMYLRLEGKSLS